jgi:ferritin-like metal-binding protein YciE
MAGISTSYNLSARFKKHYCHVCNTRLQVNRASTVVNSESDESKDFDFSFGGGYAKMIGDVRFSKDVFFCETCNKDISIKEHRAYEMEKKGIRQIPKSKIRKTIESLIFPIGFVLLTIIWMYFFG